MSSSKATKRTETGLSTVCHTFSRGVLLVQENGFNILKAGENEFPSTVITESWWKQRESYNHYKVPWVLLYLLSFSYFLTDSNQCSQEH